MRIAMIIEAWKPIWGGGQAHVFELSKELVTNYNCQVDIYVMNLKDGQKKIQKNIKLYKNTNLRIIRTGKIKDFHSTKDRLFWIFDVIKKIKKEHNLKSYDLIHAHANLPGIPGKILSQLLKIPIVYTVHGTNALDLKKKNIVYYIEKFLYTIIKYDAEISVSKKILHYKNKNVPIIIPNGVDIDKFSCKNTKHLDKNIFKILFVGRMDKVKGIDILIQAIKKIALSDTINRKIQLHLIGYGYEKYTLSQLTTSLELEKIILFKGKKMNSALTEEYCSSNLFILPSLSEGQPLTLLEAWAAKLPVIVTDVGDNKYFVKNKINGYLIPPKDVDALAKAILEAINNPQLKEMGITGHKLVTKKYSWNNVTKKTYELYKTICQK
jgi:glycosyltransferase involved in cell wall biosynthesis